MNKLQIAVFKLFLSVTIICFPIPSNNVVIAAEVVMVQPCRCVDLYVAVHKVISFRTSFPLLSNLLRVSSPKTIICLQVEQ